MTPSGAGPAADWLSVHHPIHFILSQPHYFVDVRKPLGFCGLDVSARILEREVVQFIRAVSKDEGSCLMQWPCYERMIRGGRS